MSEYIILRKHMLVNSYVLISENVTKQKLIQFIQVTPDADLKDYKFIKGKVVEPDISYKIANPTDENVMKKDVVKKIDGTISQKIFKKWSQGSIFEQNNQDAF